MEEARWLVSPGGPLKRGGVLRAGVVQHLGDGVVRMDEAAVKALSSAPGDGRVVVDGGAQVMVIGWDRYPVLPDS